MAEDKAEKRKKIAKPGAKRPSRAKVGLTATRLKKMIKKLMDTLEDDNNSTKASVGELLKLFQVYKELSAEQVKEVEVRWVDRIHPDS